MTRFTTHRIVYSLQMSYYGVMGKSKPPKSAAPQASGGNYVSRGISAYRKAMGEESAAGLPAEKTPAAPSVRPHSAIPAVPRPRTEPARPAPAGTGGIDTGAKAGAKISGKKRGKVPELKIPPEEGFLKTGRLPPAAGTPLPVSVETPLAMPRPSSAGTPPATPESKALKYRRAAQFMVLVGSDEASKILSRLEPDQVDAISKEIVSIKSISPEEAEAVLEEFRSLLSPSYGYSGSSRGGVEEARRLLYAAFGPEKGEAVLVKAVPAAAENAFDFLEDFSGEQLALLFKDESVAACAMVFSRLPSKLSAEVLANVAPQKKLDIVKRIAHLKETSPEVIERAAAALKEKARHFGRSGAVEAGAEIDGRSVLAAILKNSDPGFGSRLLEEMEEYNPSLGREMKDRLYTLEDVADASDKPIQEKLRGMDDREIALLLKGRSDAFTNKILFNISAARVRRVKEESEIMGPVPKVEAEAAAREFLAWFRLNREEGRILMLSGEDVLV